MAADLDWDGDLDVVVASARSHYVAWFENNGTGSFEAPMRVIGDEVYLARALFAADIDADGHVDVVSAVSGLGPPRVIWFRNNGTGGFGDGLTVGNASVLDLVFAADFTGDGHVDVVFVASTVENRVALFENDGEGGFLPAWRGIATSDDVFTVRALSAADFDGDGDLDLVLSSSTADKQLRWLENTDGRGTFGTTTVVPGSVPVGALFAADVDGDGDQDIVSASDNSVLFHENLDGLGTFGDGQEAAALGVEVSSLFVFDADEDNDLDVVYTNADGVVGWAGQNAQPRTVPSVVVLATAVSVADVDEDGDLDLLVAGAGSASVFLNDGSGGLAAGTTVSGERSGAFKAALGADVDGDGDPDIVYATADAVAWADNRLGTAAGGFGPERLIDSATVSFEMAAVADLDGDDSPDVVVAARTGNFIAWYRNNGTGGFEERRLVGGACAGARAVHAADLDGDNRTDVIGGCTNSVLWYRNNCTGGFDEGRVITTDARGVRGVSAADLDGDSVMDVLSASFDDGKVA